MIYQIFIKQIGRQTEVAISGFSSSGALDVVRLFNQYRHAMNDDVCPEANFGNPQLPLIEEDRAMGGLWH